MEARGSLELCISFSQSLPSTLELESTMMLDDQDGKLPTCIFSDRLLFYPVLTHPPRKWLM